MFLFCVDPLIISKNLRAKKASWSIRKTPDFSHEVLRNLYRSKEKDDQLNELSSCHEQTQGT